MKVGVSVVAARRGGLSSTFDQLNKYFTISGMPVASGQYRNSVHGGDKNSLTDTQRRGILCLNSLSIKMIETRNN